MKKLFLFILAIAIGVGSSWVYTYCWNGFFPKVFGLPEMNLVSMYFLTSFMTIIKSIPSKNEESDYVYMLSYSISRTALILATFLILKSHF